jgi:hypothetical protein
MQLLNKVDRLEFENDLIVHDDIRDVATVQVYTVVLQWK